MRSTHNRPKDLLEDYAEIAGHDVMRNLDQLAASLRGARVVHVNSTRAGGGVAEILEKLVPLKQALGIDAHWQTVSGPPEYYQCTKGFHNALQGLPVVLPERLLDAYERTNASNAEMLHSMLNEADFVFIHDPQPAALIRHFPERRGLWIWRFHIDASHPYRPVWKYLHPFVTAYNASVFSMPQFAQAMPHPQYIIPPSIDPLSDKNRALSLAEVARLCAPFNLDAGLPLILQVSRFDRFKDPLGVVEAFRLASKLTPMQLVLAGGGATDDPEGERVFDEVLQATRDDPAMHVLMLPVDAHLAINALQRTADLVLQKSLREGFGLTVAEAMWKGRPVIGGDTGGIRLQVINHYTGFLVSTPEGAALRIRYLLHRRDKLMEMGERAQRFVRENFLITRQLRDYLTLMVGLMNGSQERIEVGI